VACSNRLRALAFAAFAIGFMPAHAHAQEIGARFGATLSNIVFDTPDLLEVQARVGWVGGGFVAFLPKARVGLQVEGLISRRVIRFLPSVDDTLTYLEIPGLVRVNVYRGETFVVHALGGGGFHYLLSASESIDGGDADDVKAAFKPWEFALVVGADAQLKERWVFSARYLYGLTQVYQASDDFPATQRGFQFTAGYRFK
jgi:hypothetical protein